MNIEQLQERVGYSFNNPTLLRQALTHKSFGHEVHSQMPLAHRDNERFEFLGDAILQMIISDILLIERPEADEGELTKVRSGVVNEKSLAALAQTMDLSSFLYLGRGELQSNGHLKPSILSNAFEALIASVYLDGGFEAVYKVIRKLFSPLLVANQSNLVFSDFKTQLQEFLQAKWKAAPTYHVLNTSGPDHARMFEIEVHLNQEKLASGSGTSKKEAEQNAAQAAISHLNNRKEK